MSSPRNLYAWDIDVALNGDPLRPAWVSARLDEALSHARREGRRMWRSGVFHSVRLVVRRRHDGSIRLDWRRTKP